MVFLEIFISQYVLLAIVSLHCVTRALVKRRFMEGASVETTAKNGKCLIVLLKFRRPSR
jgi:hypothetical protein